MDAAVLERAYEAFQEFHGYFAPVFGRKEARENSSHYLQALLVQSEERRNAENLSETVPASSRALQRFLSESPWDDDAVIGRLQEYLSSRLKDSQGVWVLDGSDFPKQGMKSVGVVRQYCGALGKIANCEVVDKQGCFWPTWTWAPARTAPSGGDAHQGLKNARGRALVDKRLYLPEEWTGRSRGVSGPRGAQGTGAGGQEAVSAGGMDWGRGALCDGGSAGGPTGVPKQD